MRTISRLFDDVEVTLELKETFAKVAEALEAPFTPNFFQVWAAAPDALKGIWPVMQHILTSGKLSRRLKEMMFVAISSLKECQYCESAHHAFCLNTGVTSAQIKQLAQNFAAPASVEKERVAIAFAVKLAKNSNSSTDEDIKQLESLGYTTEEIMEIIAMSGMAVFYNHLANATQIIVDSGFSDILAQYGDGQGDAAS